MFLFLGDYYGEVHQPNEVAALMQACRPKLMIRGNKENSLGALEGKNPETWTDEQFAPLYWNHRTLREKHRHLWINLPEALTFAPSGLPPVYLAHSAIQHFGPTTADRFGGRTHALQNKYSQSHKDYLEEVHHSLQGDEKLMRRLRERPPGVYLFGHTHTQWYAAFDGRVLVNPGSCGAPLEGTRATYTLLVAQDGVWHVEERQVVYPVEPLVEELKASELYRVSPIWGDMTTAQLRTGHLEQVFFIELAQEVAREQNDACYPFSHAVWQETCRRWRATHTYE